MISYWGEDIAYDELGNPLNWINGETLTWQNGRQLASVDGVSYGYNADGLRVSKTWARGSTEYYVVDGQYIGEKSVRNGTQYFITYTYDENGSPAGINVNGTQYWFVKNLQGDVTAILDSSGAVVANYRYDAYGYIISITNGSGANVGLTDSGHIARLNPFRYRGYMYDEETEFYYLRSRYYNPEIGRFLNADGYVSTGQGFTGYNMFAYCNNDPISHEDSTGTFATTVLGDVITLKTAGTKNPKTVCPNKKTGLEPELYIAYGGVEVELKNGWSFRIDPARPNQKVKRHIHIYKNNEKYAKCIDGSPHDGNTGGPPNSVKKEVFKKTGWDWDKKEKSYNNHKQSFIYDPNCDWENGNCEGHGILPYGGLYYMPTSNGSMPMPTFFPFGVPAFG